MRRSRKEGTPVQRWGFVPVAAQCATLSVLAKVSGAPAWPVQINVADLGSIAPVLATSSAQRLARIARGALSRTLSGAHLSQGQRDRRVPVDPTSEHSRTLTRPYHRVDGRRRSDQRAFPGPSSVIATVGAARGFGAKQPIQHLKPPKPPCQAEVPPKMTEMPDAPRDRSSCLTNLADPPSLAITRGIPPRSAKPYNGRPNPKILTFDCICVMNPFAILTPEMPSIGGMKSVVRQCIVRV